MFATNQVTMLTEAEQDVLMWVINKNLHQLKFLNNRIYLNFLFEAHALKLLYTLYDTLYIHA